jgi:hypothetical protein
LDAGPSPDDEDFADAGGADDAGEPFDETDDAGDRDAGPGGASTGGSSDGRPAVGDDTEGEANAIVTPLEVDPNADGSVTLTLNGETEDFTYSAGAGGWVGEEGSFLIGGPDLFDDATGWSVILSLDENGNPSIEICHGGQCEPVRLDERYTP